MTKREKQAILDVAKEVGAMAAADREMSRYEIAVWHEKMASTLRLIANRFKIDPKSKRRTR